MSDPVFYPRSIERRLAEALEDSPVVLIHGPRQYTKNRASHLRRLDEYAEDVTWMETLVRLAPAGIDDRSREELLRTATGTAQ